MIHFSGFESSELNIFSNLVKVVKTILSILGNILSKSYPDFKKNQDENKVQKQDKKTWMGFFQYQDPLVLQQQMALSTSASNPASMNSAIGGEAVSLTSHNNETNNTLSMSKSPVTDNKVYLVFKETMVNIQQVNIPLALKRKFTVSNFPNLLNLSGILNLPNLLDLLDLSDLKLLL